jgi:DNA-binding transcriptional ArsR family regulator
MPAEPTRENLDVERLSTYLKALANPARLELLWLLRIPTASSDIVLTPRRRDESLSPSRPMSRQAVEEHLQGLEELGVVERMEDAEGKSTQRVLNQARLFALLEELRALTAIRPSVRVDVDATLASGAEAGAPDWVPGPKLVLASGPLEGRAFPLAGEGPWGIGRSRGQVVALSYDPYASAEHARIVAHGKGHALEAFAEARNACRVNFAPLAPGGRRVLRAGDIVGVGRSLLVYQDA